MNPNGPNPDCCTRCGHPEQDSDHDTWLQYQDINGDPICGYCDEDFRDQEAYEDEVRFQWNNR